ncbi:Lipase 3 [Cyphellophora attinorum]|uniref:Lipase 3 n=1 Tax=Cyphellophora attinorum TaxID=1664694 RepID=A0A0N1H671_9EURO|nr:Lipase 3 [Phialophora attinorum]KPI37534.1 Lipase 3 [Phialophora attinorum]
MSATLYAPSLRSQLIGEYDERHDLAYFRGIPYATIKQRWTHSTILHELPNKFNAEKFGPRCPQEEGAVLVSGGMNDPTPGDSEFDCLNLNICVPRECLEQFQNGHRKRKVPVMFWIHGGGFRFGANSVARYRPHALCSRARESGRPIILVQIGYRLGPLGFAASDALQAEFGTSPNATGPASGNYGFEDQRNALRWVHEHIADFGGDPDNVTAFGVSAGSASVHYHILTGDPMFDKAICMSGTGGTLGPLDPQYYQQAWDALCAATGLRDASAVDQVTTLRKAPVMDILQKYSNAAMGPVGDGVLLPRHWKFEDTLITRCRSIILGDTNVEGIILDSIARNIKPEQMLRTIQEIIVPKNREISAAISTSLDLIKNGRRTESRYDDSWAI